MGIKTKQSKKEIIYNERKKNFISLASSNSQDYKNFDFLLNGNICMPHLTAVGWL